MRTNPLPYLLVAVAGLFSGHLLPLLATPAEKIILVTFNILTFFGISLSIVMTEDEETWKG